MTTTCVSENDLENYIADHYGACRLAKCTCLRDTWRGRGCTFWIPVTAKNWDEIGAIQREGYPS